MANVRINYDSVVKKGDPNHKIIEIFREKAIEVINDFEGKFLFDFIRKYQQFDLLECPEDSYNLIVEIDKALPGYFITNVEAYKDFQLN